MISTTSTRSDLLRNLIQIGVIDPILSPCDERTITNGFFKYFKTLAKSRDYEWHKESLELFTASQSTRWQEHRFETALHDTVTDHWAIELARFCVPEGNVGYVTYLEQVVNDVNGDYYPTNVTYWGSPRFVFPDVDNLRWYLKLSHYPGTQPGRYELSSTVPIPAHALPGYPYPDLPIIDAIWYPAHCSRHLKLLVPGATMLRFYMITPPCVTYQWEVSGKISGWIQSSYQVSAAKNAREIS